MITPVPAPMAPVTSTPMPATPLPMNVHGDSAEPLKVNAAETESIVPSPDSPLPETPTSWQKISWREDSLDAVSVTEASAGPNLLQDWAENSSESSSCSDSDDEPTEEARGAAGGHGSEPSVVVHARAKWFINSRTLVIHERRNETLFKCGRVIGSPYEPVHQLTGLRCGKCFASTL